MSQQNQTNQPAQSNTTADEEATNHLRFMVSALQVANKRGMFELEESGNIQDAVKFFGGDTDGRDETEQVKHLQTLVGMSEIAQRRGAFNLAEAATVYPHVNYFRREEPALTENQTEETPAVVDETTEATETCDKNTCDKANCNPEDCPCDTDGNCKSNIESTIEKVEQSDREAGWDKFDN